MKNKSNRNIIANPQIVAHEVWLIRLNSKES